MTQKRGQNITRRPASADTTARGQFQATGQPVSWTQASDAMTSRLPRYEAKCVQRRCFQCGSVALRSDTRGTELPLPIYWYHSKGNWLRYNVAADSFYIMLILALDKLNIRSSWPTDLGSVSRDAYLTMKVSTNFEVDTTIRCLVIALLLLIRYVTLNVDRFWWNLVTRTLLWSSFAATIMVHIGRRGTARRLFEN